MKEHTKRKRYRILSRIVDFCVDGNLTGTMILKYFSENYDIGSVVTTEYVVC